MFEALLRLVKYHHQINNGISEIDSDFCSLFEMSRKDSFDNPKVCIIDFSNDGSFTKQLESRWAPTLSEVLKAHLPNTSSRLILVQGLNGMIESQLKGIPQVEEEFFDTHSDNPKWYLTYENTPEDPRFSIKDEGEIRVQPGQPKRIHSLAPSLPSQRAKSDSIKLCFINARQFPCPPSSLPGGVNIAYSDNLCASSYLHHTESRRTGLVVQQFSPSGQNSNDTTVMFAHTSVSAWFKMKPNGTWTGEYTSLQKIS